MKEPNNKCYLCKDRKENCHAVCISYISYRKNYDEYKQLVIKNKSKNYLLIK